MLSGWCVQRGPKPFTSSTRPWGAYGFSSMELTLTTKNVLLLPESPTSHPHLEFVFQFTRVLPKNKGASVQNLGHLLYREKTFLLENTNNALNVPLMHGEDFRATEKHRL